MSGCVMYISAKNILPGKGAQHQIVSRSNWPIATRYLRVQFIGFPLAKDPQPSGAIDAAVIAGGVIKHFVFLSASSFQGDATPTDVEQVHTHFDLCTQHPKR